MNSRSTFVLLLLLSVTWTLAPLLGQMRASFSGPTPKGRQEGSLTALLGESRQLLARHFFTKADVYFHKGYYPSFFDQALKRQAGEDAATVGKPGEERCESDFGSKPRDWIDAFGRNFYPSQHTHLGEGKAGEGQEREILPWLQMSLNLSPEDVESYTLAAYWLDRRLKKPKEAELVLRDGLASNPGNPELLLELGRVIYGQGQDTDRARNLWESAWRRWQHLESNNTKPDPMIAERTLASLAELEERSGNFARAVEHLTALKSFSPHPEVIQQSIEQLKTRLATEPPAVKPL